MILDTVTFETRTNTVSVKWVNEIKDQLGAVVGYESAQYINFSSSQKADALALVPNLGDFINLAKWI